MRKNEVDGTQGRERRVWCRDTHMPIITALGWGRGKKSLECVGLAWQPGETVTKRRGGEGHGKKTRTLQALTLVVWGDSRVVPAAKKSQPARQGTLWQFLNLLVCKFSSL